MRPIRVLVAEDSPTVRKRLVRALANAAEVEVVGEAENGARAFQMCQRLRPDVVTLDIMMPEVTGLEATERIMAYCPTPILIVSASLNRGEAFQTYDALAAGAIDVLEKPTGKELGDAWERRFISSIRLVARVKVERRIRGQVQPFPLRPTTPLQEGGTPLPALGGKHKLIAVGASTGGPKAVADILKTLPANFPLPILLVIHISRIFASSLGEWLESQSAIPVATARDGEALPPTGQGRVYLAPPDYHLTLKHGRIRLDSGPERHSCRPAVDVLFESVAREAGSQALGCLLTGMGRDGAQGLLAMRQAGATTWVQDEESSVVFGMPQEAIRLKAAERILPVNQMGSALLGLTYTFNGEPKLNR